MARVASLLILTALSLWSSAETAQAQQRPTYLFGTLQSDPSHAAADYSAGARLAELDLNWGHYEPADGLFDQNYINQMGRKSELLRKAGFAISLSVNLGDAPRWLLNHPEANYVNQFGAKQGPNLVFTQFTRVKATTYITHIAQDLGTEFYSMRIGFSPDSSELLYPPANDSHGHINSLWAYDPTAQNTNPYPGWRPGDRTYRGRPFSTAQVGEWYDWYINSLVQTGDWEQALFKSLGFTGYMAWLTPGPGMRPFETRRYVTSYLMGENYYDRVVGPVGAVWNKVIDRIVDKSKVQIQNTGIGDASGNPLGNVCQPTDLQVRMDDPIIANWSGGRWTSYNADRWGLHKTGENPGPHDSAAVIKAVADVVTACRMDAWFYAFDFSLHDGTPGAATTADVRRQLGENAGIGSFGPNGPITWPVVVEIVGRMRGLWSNLPPPFQRWEL